MSQDVYKRQPIETTDVTLARQHCVINVKKNKAGGFIYTLRDFPSVSGTSVSYTHLDVYKRQTLLCFVKPEI